MGQRRRQPPLPAPEEALDRTRTQLIADPLQRLRVGAVAEAIVQGGVADSEPVTLALRSGVGVESDSHWPGA